MLHQSLRFLYDGWNLIAEIGDTGRRVRSYVWGVDVSGTFQGEGGIGGLLFEKQHLKDVSGIEEWYSFGYDCSSNVTVLVNMASGQSEAVYEYGPFGELLRASGGIAGANPFRFATKYHDMETELSYFGHRYYQASAGRWISKDPLGELGGINLYGAVGNNFLCRTDYLGLKWKVDRTGESRGKSRAKATCDCGDTVKDLADDVHLDPAEFEKWLEPEKGKKRPNSVDTQLEAGQTFTVPNTILLSYGDMRRGELEPDFKTLLRGR